MHKLYLDLDARKPQELGLYESLRERIVGGELKPGQRLPPTRTMARELAVSRNAVVAAYGQLRSEGYLQARVGSGTWVSRELPDSHLLLLHIPPTTRNGSPRAQPALSELARRATQRLRAAEENTARERIDFSLESTLADDLSIDTWERLVREQVRRVPSGYGPPEGCPELRHVLAEHLRESRGIRADPDQIVVVAGAQQGIDLVGRALLQPGDGVLMEEPGFRGARLAFEILGARIVPCPVDREGVNVRHAAAPRLSVAAADDDAGPVRLSFVTPSHQFPTGAVMSLARRRELLAWAHAADAIVVEDDYEEEFRFEGRALPAIHALDREARVVYVGTFSRVLYPDLRLGYLVLPRSLVEPIVALKRLSDWFTPVTPQAALATFLRGGHYQRHLRRLRLQMRARRRLLLARLEEQFGDEVEVTGAASGLHVAVWFRDPGPEAEAAFLENACDLGVGVHPVSPFYAGAPPRLGALLGYSRLRDAEIREGVRRLAMAWRATRRAMARPHPSSRRARAG